MQQFAFPSVGMRAPYSPQPLMSFVFCLEKPDYLSFTHKDLFFTGLRYRNSMRVAYIFWWPVPGVFFGFFHSLDQNFSVFSTSFFFFSEQFLFSLPFLFLFLLLLSFFFALFFPSLPLYSPSSLNSNQVENTQMVIYSESQNKHSPWSVTSKLQM